MNIFSKEKRRVEQVEKELPLALRAIATELSIHLPFEECFKSLGKGYGELSKDFQRIDRRIEAGDSVQEALLDWAEKTRSRQVRRVVMQLISSYENKEDPQALKKLSEELLSQQRTRMREYSSQIVMYSLVFIGVSAVFPSLFQAFVIIGSSFMSSTVTPEQAFLIPVIGFPLVDLAVLLMIRARRPA